MAYGLHSIAHKNYTPYGSGRDWFFIGDFEYREGRKTPVGQLTGKRPSRPPAQKRGAPTEVAFQRALASSGKAKSIQRWQRLAEEQAGACGPQQPAELGAALASAPRKGAVGTRNMAVTTEAWTASSWQHGQHPGWQGSRYELANGVELEGAGAIRACSAPAMGREPGPGDHTRGIRGAAPHFAPESWKLGKDPSYSGKRFDLPDGTELEGAGAIRGPPLQEGEAASGDHTLGIRSKAPHFRADYHKLGQVPGWQHLEEGSPLKHHNHSVPCYPDLVRRSKSDTALSSTAPSGGKAATGDAGGPEVKRQEGDHTLGIRARKPHFTSTYDDHGQIPGWKGKRFDFGPLANTRLRLTEWGRSKS